MSLSDNIKKAINEPAKLRRYLKIVARSIPFRLRLTSLIPRSLFVQFTPDRYSILIDTYRKRGLQVHDPYGKRRFVKQNYGNAGDMSRYYFLMLSCEQIVKEGLRGDVAELGVYKGNTAYILAELARKLGTTAFLFDTYEGFADRDLVGVDSGVRSDVFTDSSLDLVRDMVGDENVQFVKGYFPDSLSQVSGSPQFCMVHIDCDLYEPFKHGLEYFYPRLIDGGMIIMHDYSSLVWDGAERAIDEFFEDKPERLVLIPDKSGTAVIRKAMRNQI